jgi:hypothetical protein
MAMFVFMASNQRTRFSRTCSMPLARQFECFAERECAGEPLYDAMCRIAAGEPGVLDLVRAAPHEQRRPILLLAAVHDLVLAGDSHPLAGYFPSIGGTREVDAALREHFLGFCERHAETLRDCIARRTTQTNEIGRCAVLWPVLRHVAASTGHSRLALLDFGCSAGLNLGVDSYRYDYGSFTLGAPAGPAVPTITCRLVGPRVPVADEAAPWAISQRLGIDPAPVDVDDEGAVRWLRACTWPHDQTRRQRVDQAVRLAREQRWPVRQAADCTAATRSWAAQLSGDTLPVVFNSWVLTYMARDALAQHVQQMQALVQERGVVWICAEEPALVIGNTSTPQPPGDAGIDQATPTLWTMVSRGPDAPHYQVLARSHPHGKWLEWLA